MTTQHDKAKRWWLRWSVRLLLIVAGLVWWPLLIVATLICAYLAWPYGLAIVMVMLAYVSGGAAFYAYVDVIRAEGRQKIIPIIGTLILTVVFMGFFLGLVGVVVPLIIRLIAIVHQYWAIASTISLN